MNRKPPGLPPSLRPHRADGDWRPRLRKAVDMVVAFTCQFEGPDPGTLRDAVLRGLRAALGDASGDEIAKTMELDLRDGLGIRPVEMASMAGIFRIVAIDSGIDFTEPSKHEVFACEAQRRLQEILDTPALLAAIRSGKEY